MVKEIIIAQNYQRARAYIRDKGLNQFDCHIATERDHIRGCEFDKYHIVGRPRRELLIEAAIIVNRTKSTEC